MQRGGAPSMPQRPHHPAAQRHCEGPAWPCRRGWGAAVTTECGADACFSAQSRGRMSAKLPALREVTISPITSSQRANPCVSVQAPSFWKQKGPQAIERMMTGETHPPDSKLRVSGGKRFSFLLFEFRRPLRQTGPVSAPPSSQLVTFFQKPHKQIFMANTKHQAADL